MSVHGLYGKPGSGKSMLGTKYAITQLTDSQRNIVTNLPLNPGRLNEYVQERFPGINTKFVERVRILSDEELPGFWNFRGPPTPEKPGGDDQGRGVCYILDECHIAFNARDWANLGRGAINYLSQHRKLGDIVFFITQAPGNVDKQFRSIAEDHTVLRNEYTAKFGPFRGMGRFVRKSYYAEPNGQKSEPFETVSFTLDVKGVASCYDTARGIGVHGSKADIGRRAKGLSIWWVMPAVMVLGSCCVFVPWLIGKSVGRFIAPPVQGAGAKGAPVSQDTVVPGVAGTHDGSRDPRVKPPASVGPATPIPKPSGLSVTGYVMMPGNRVNVQLSDGRNLVEGDGDLVRIEKRGRAWVFHLASGETLRVQAPSKAVAPNPVANPLAPVKG